MTLRIKPNLSYVAVFDYFHRAHRNSLINFLRVIIVYFKKNICKKLFQAFWIQTTPAIWSDLIWNQTVWKGY